MLKTYMGSYASTSSHLEHMSLCMYFLWQATLR